MGLLDQPDMTADVMTGAKWDEVERTLTAWDAAWAIFEQSMRIELEAAPDPAVGKNDLARTRADLVTTGAEYVAAIEAFGADATSLIGSTQDIIYSVRDEIAALDALSLAAVEAISNEPATWAEKLLADATDVGTLLQRELGIVAESMVAAVMESNQPGYIPDPFALPAGLLIKFPVNLDEFS